MFSPVVCRPAGPWCSARHRSAYKSSTERRQAAPGARNRQMTKRGKRAKVRGKGGGENKKRGIIVLKTGDLDMDVQL